VITAETITSSGLKPESDLTVKVIDAMMGTGKTTYIHKWLNDQSTYMDSYIYITPTLDEMVRVDEACPELYFVDPYPKDGSKLNSLNQYLSESRNIATTHSLFTSANIETVVAIDESAKDYHLIIDESVSCVENYKVDKGTLRALKKADMVKIDSVTGLVSWDYDEWAEGAGTAGFQKVKALCDKGSLFVYKEMILMFELPPTFLKACKSVTILTYKFSGSIMAAYFEAHNIKVEYVNTQELGLESNEVLIGKAKHLINVVGLPDARDTKTREHYEAIENGLSVTWYSNATKGRLKALSNAMTVICKRYKPKGAKCIWTCFKDYQKQVAGAGFAKTKNGKDKKGKDLKNPEYYGWLNCGARATNNYSDVQLAMYCVDRYPNTTVKGFLYQKGGFIDKDEFALSEMLQWIWRTAIRDGKPITVFIPSKRMRRLLEDWLQEGETVTLH
jgi:hypothetical protein